MKQNSRVSGLKKLFHVDFSLCRHPFRSTKNVKLDRRFLLFVALLCLVGSVTVFSAGSAYAEVRYGDPWFFAKRQFLWLLIGSGAFYLGLRVKPEIYRSLTPLFYLFTLFLLILTLLIGMVGNGAQRWISIGPITLQPSEIAKLTLVLMLARYFSDFQEKSLLSKSKKDVFFFGTAFPLTIAVVPILLVMLQKHLSCIIILGCIAFTVCIAAGVGLRYYALIAGIGVGGVSALALFTDYTKERITVWLNPEMYRLEGGWQTLQGLMAIGSGGVFGNGIGGSVLKYCYVSEPANDMIFAILCEETGLVGALSVLLLFFLLIKRGFRLSLKQRDPYARIVMFGILCKIAVQTLLNVAVVTNTIPNTGISLPFFSYGGSSLIMILFEMGMFLSLSESEKTENEVST